MKKAPVQEAFDLYHKTFNESCSVASINDSDDCAPVIVETCNLPARRRSKFHSLSPASKPPLYKSSILEQKSKNRLRSIDISVPIHSQKEASKLKNTAAFIRRMI